MEKKMRSKGMLRGLALALALLPFITYPLPAFATPSSCGLSGVIGGYPVTRPPVLRPGDLWSFAVTSSTCVASTPSLVKGTVSGTFTFVSSVFTPTDSAVSGGWMFRVTDGALFIKLIGNGFSVDLALQSLPPVGFTFVGNLFVQGIPQPIALVKTSGGLTCTST